MVTYQPLFYNGVMEQRDEPTPAQARAWHTFMQMQEVLNARLGQHLQKTAQLSNADFAILVVLSESPEGRCRVVELGRMLAWEKSRLHHQLTRMCARGLVRRTNDPAAARTTYAEITPAGLAAIQAVAPAHNREVQRLFFDAVRDDQVEHLYDISSQVLSLLYDEPARDEASDEHS